MPRQSKALYIGVVALLILSACSSGAAIDTTSWETFRVEEAPGFDLQFMLPPDWDYALQPPTEDLPGIWNMVIATPQCSTANDTSYSDYCINLTAYVKDEADFDKEEILAYISEAISVVEDDSIKSILIGQTSTEINGVSIQRFNHKITNPERDIQMAIFFLESNHAYYLIIYSVPYEEKEGEFAMTFQKVLETIALKD